MKKFEKISTINCKIEDLFEFHLDMKNLENITPPNTKVELLNKDFVPHEGGILKIRTVKNFIPITWEVKIDKIQKPNLLVDIAIKSPFKYWKHSHVFTQKGNICELKDVLEYELPFGKFGNLFDFFIQNEFKKMFDYRHKITKEILNLKDRS